MSHQKDIAFRQIHLDFHTAPQAPDVGGKFDGKEFARVLKDAHVNSITCFSKCHHGMIYHDTQFPARHPNLKCNLLAEQIEACHSAGIRVPIYISAGFDMHQYLNDPGLVQVDSDGKTLRAEGSQEPGWALLCFNSRYLDYLEAETLEVLDKFDTDAIFYDIILHDCCCQRCVDMMRKQGLDPKNPQDRRQFNRQTIYRFRERMWKVIRSKNKDCGIFFNSGHVDYTMRPSLDHFTHLELESLPSGGWGYDHFPITGRYARKLDKSWIMMTGRFHTTWGHFGSYKHPVALEYEVLRSIGMGGGVSVGDQLHPSGQLESATYELIGGAFEMIEKVEDRIKETEPVTEVGILWAESTLSEGSTEGNGLTPSDRGAFRMCLENKLFADFIDPQMDFSKYRLIILPDKCRLDEVVTEKLKQFLADGGSIVCSAEAGMKQDADEFALPIPLKVNGPAEYLPEYILSKTSLGENVPDAPLAMYHKGWNVDPLDGAEVLADAYRPYFNREAGRFCGHYHWPVQGPADRPAAVRAGNIIYFAYPIFAAYEEYAIKYYKQMVTNAVEILMPDRLLQSNLPSTAQVELLEGESGIILTLMHYVPENRSKKIPTIEESLPLVDVELELKTSGPVSAVNVLLGEVDGMTFTSAGDKVTLRFNKVFGKVMLELQK